MNIEVTKSMARFSLKNYVMMLNDENGLGNSADYHRGKLEAWLLVLGGEWGHNELGYHIDWNDGTKEYLIEKDYTKINMFTEGEWQII